MVGWIVLGAIILALCWKRLSIAFFGRKRSTLAKLTEPSELARGLWPDPQKDTVIRKLREWNPKPTSFTWQPLWITETEGLNSVTINHIELLFRPLGPCRPPYELIDLTPSFIEQEPPAEPSYVSENYPLPTLSLPFWNPPLSFLNKYVRTAHTELVTKCKQLELQAGNLKESAKELNQARKQAWEEARERHQTAISISRKNYDNYMRLREKYIEPLRKAKTSIFSADNEGVTQHFDLALRCLSLPSFLPRQWLIRFEPETKTLLVEHRFPETTRLEVTKIVEQSRGSVVKPASQTARKSLVSKIQPALCLQLARAMADADTFGLIEAIAVNGWIDFFDRATGHPKRAYCVSLIAKKQALLDLNLETLDFVTAFNALRGTSAGETYETAPVMPSLHMQTDDPRFVESRDTIEKMAKGENLAAMDWEDFEHLVRELFDREFAAIGAEVKITRVSRDQGVDAIIFDPDPLRGGKIVIQAKRYTIPVDVSAVRDLYGTVLNEGANTGILVTTSHYGSEAYEFAQKKPLKLINGAQLLGLLDKNGYKFRIDLAKARAIMARP